jgi:hypothetical protein
MECYVARHGLQLKLNALIDSGAGGKAFIHPKLLPAIKRYFQVKVLKIKQGGVGVSGFNNKPASTISRVFNLDLLIAGRHIPTWFLVCDTGRHDIFIGRIWLAKNRALVDCKDRAVRWKDEQSCQQLVTGVPSGLTIPATEIAKGAQGAQIDKRYQKDADRRDALLERQIYNG